jgi:hypothetical protein
MKYKYKFYRKELLKIFIIKIFKITKKRVKIFFKLLFYNSLLPIYEQLRSKTLSIWS